MNTIDKTFELLRQRGEKAFIPYITAGDPNLSVTEELLHFFSTNGADIIEVGIPFSDPMADGPVIQAAMERGLRSGTTLKRALGTIRKFKRHHATPIILMGYLNPFLAYGFRRFAEDARSAGVDGVLIVDLPPEEAHMFIPALKKNDIVPVFLVSPVSGTDRIKKIGAVAKGFLYYVSITGTTGERATFPEATRERLAEIKAAVGLPVVMGFGISGPHAIREFLPHADGFVVGSALVKRLNALILDAGKRQAFDEYFLSLVTACHIKLQNSS